MIFWHEDTKSPNFTKLFGFEYTILKYILLMPDYWIDTHAHIYSDEFKADREDTLARSHEFGIGKIYMPNVDHTSIDGMMEVELKSPQQYISMMGLHPCSVKAD